MNGPISYSAAAINEVASLLLKASDKQKIWTFDGPMGAGKTTLIKAICQKLGVQDVVSSPTYTIVNEYLRENDLIYHIDAYRLNNLQEALDIGIDEILEEGIHYTFVEWPENISDFLPEHYFSIKLSYQADGRMLHYQLI